MAEELYNVVFKGELVRSFELAEVKKNVAKLFKVDGPKLEALFSGKPVVLKKNVNFEGANKYRVAIKKAGARVDLQPVETAATASGTRASSGKATFGSVSPQKGSVTSSATKSAASAISSGGTRPAAAAKGADDSAFNLAPPGALVLEHDERKRVAAPKIDVSSLSVKAQNGNLVETGELVKAKPIDQSGFELNLEKVGLASVGENLVRENERKRKRPVKVDVSGFSIAKPGARLDTIAKPKAPAPPDISKYRLEH